MLLMRTIASLQEEVKKLKNTVRLNFLMTRIY